MSLPNVNITLGNGNLGRTAPNTDSVSGMVLAGKAVTGKLELNKHYMLSSTRDLATLGIVTVTGAPEDAVTNSLLFGEITNFYAQAGEGAELHLVVVSEATTLSQMCDPAPDSALSKLIDGAGGRVRIAAINRTPTYEGEGPGGGIEVAIADMKSAIAKGHALAKNYADKMKPFRLLVPFMPFNWDGGIEDLYSPCEDSYNRVGVVAVCNASGDSQFMVTTALVLGRSAAIEVHRSIGRVKDGAIATDAALPNTVSYIEGSAMAAILHDAGYIVPVGYPTRNGAYLSGDHMAAPATDDYSSLAYGRVIDKASVIAYETYVGEILDNIKVDDKGNIEVGACKSYEAMIENAVAVGMGGSISRFSATIDPAQNVLSSGVLNIECRITPQGVLHQINVNLAFENPALKQ